MLIDSYSVNAVAVTPDGKRVISGSRDTTLKVWDLADGKVLFTLEGHSDWVNAVAVTPDGKRVISGSDDTTLKVWDDECIFYDWKGWRHNHEHHTSSPNCLPNRISAIN